MGIKQLKFDVFRLEYNFVMEKYNFLNKQVEKAIKKGKAFVYDIPLEIAKRERVELIDHLHTLSKVSEYLDINLDDEVFVKLEC